MAWLRERFADNRSDWNFYLGLVAVLALILVLWGLASHGPVQKDGKVVISYWTGWTGHEFAILKEIVDDFNRQHEGICVKVTSIPGSSGVYQKTRIALAGHDTPDVVSTIWESELAEYASRGYLEPLDGHMKRSDRSLDEFLSAVQAYLRYRGKVYALAISVNSQFIVYNRQVLREVGCDPDAFPKTTREMDALADKCDVRDEFGNYTRYGYRPGGLLTWARMFGGKWYDVKTGRVTADDPRNVAALKWMVSRARPEDLRRMSALDSSMGSVFSGNNPFYSGRVAFKISGEWEDRFIKRYKPGFDWGFAPLPSPPGGKTFASSVGGSVFVIPAASKHKKEAWEFVNWITSPGPVARFASVVGNLPPLRVVAARKGFRRCPVMEFGARLADSPQSFSAPSMPIWQMYNTAIGRAEEQAMLNGRDPAEALREVRLRMQAALDRFERQVRR